MANRDMGTGQYDPANDPNDPNQQQWQQDEDQSGLVGEGPTDESGLVGSGSTEDPYRGSAQRMPNQAEEYDQQQRDDERSAGSTGPYDPNAPQQDQYDPNMTGTNSDAGMPQNPAQADNQY